MNDRLLVAVRRERLALGCLVAMALLMSAGSLGAWEGKDALGGQRVAGLYINAQVAYQQFIDQVRSIDDPKSAIIRATIVQIVAAAQMGFVQARDRAGKAGARPTPPVPPEVIDAGSGDDEAVEEVDAADVPDESAPTAVGMPGNPARVVPPEAMKAAEQLLADGIKQILEFDKKAVLIPTGGLWLSVSQAPGVVAFLEAKVKPLELLALVEPLLKGGPMTITKRDAALVVFEFPSPRSGGRVPTLEISPTGLQLRAVPDADDAAQISPELQPVVDQAKDKQTLLALEILGKPLQGALQAPRGVARQKACMANMRVLAGALEMYNMDHSDMATDLVMGDLVNQQYLKSAPTCPANGSYKYCGKKAPGNFEISCVVHGTVDNPQLPPQKGEGSDAVSPADKRMAAIYRIRAVMHPQGSYIQVALTDPEVRAEAMKGLEAVVQQVRAKAAEGGNAMVPSGLGLSPDAVKAEQARMQKILDGVKIVDKDNWIGLSMADSPPLVLTMAMVGVGAAVAIPNFVKARSNAQDRACRANRMVLESGIEMYGMDHPEDVNKVTPDKLVEGKYLKSAPTCPEGGTYSFTLGQKDQHRVRCSKHLAGD